MEKKHEGVPGSTPTEQVTNQVYGDQDTDEFLSSVSTMSLSIGKGQLTEILCDYITAIEDDVLLR
jgi:hypothetical protein